MRSSSAPNPQPLSSQSRPSALYGRACPPPTQVQLPSEMPVVRCFLSLQAYGTTERVSSTLRTSNLDPVPQIDLFAVCRKIFLHVFLHDFMSSLDYLGRCMCMEKVELCTTFCRLAPFWGHSGPLRIPLGRLSPLLLFFFAQTLFLLHTNSSRVVDVVPNRD